MRQGLKHYRVFGLLLSLLAGVALPIDGALAKTAPDDISQVRTGSFAGAYLAARTAETENNLDAAVDFYQQALSYDPDNSTVQQSLLLALLTEGRFEDALPLAEKLRDVPEIERFSRVALAIDAISKKQYAKVSPLLMLSLQSEMDMLATALMEAWTELGRGNPKKALEDVRSIEGPEWFALFRTYNAALIADILGDKQNARNFFQQAVDDRPGGSAAPDTYERIIMAYASFKLRQGDKEGAIKLLKEAEELLNGRLTIAELRRQIEAGRELPRLVETPQQGAAEVLYTLGTAINRGGAEAFAKLYLQLSLPLRPDD